MMDPALKECLQGVLDSTTNLQKLIEDLEGMLDSDFSEIDMASNTIADISNKVDEFELLLRELIDNG